MRLLSARHAVLTAYVTKIGQQSHHLSIRQYRKPDGAVLPLIQIAPSKTDENAFCPAPHAETTAMPPAASVAMLMG